MDAEEQLNKMYRAGAEFGIAFAEYVKEVDPNLWGRARDFALDHANKVDGIFFVKSEDGDDEE